MVRLEKKFKLIVVALSFAALSLFAQDPWANFKYPTIVFLDKDNGTTEGAKIYHRLIPDPQSYMKEVCRDVSRLIYNNASEVRTFDKLNYYIRNYDGVSGKWGNPPEIYIEFSTKYINEYYTSHNKSDVLMESEILGVLFHEMTHGYQWEPKNCGDYQSGTEFFGFIEGLADGDRIRAGYHQDRTPNSSSQKWTAGYTTTGFFYNWITNNYDQDFLRKLNATCLTTDPWTLDKACKQILNKGADELWTAYTQALSSVGTKPVVDFVADHPQIGSGGAVIFTNSTTNADFYDWTFDGGTPRKSYVQNPPPVTYSAQGKYKVILVAHNKKPIGPGIKVKRDYIQVGATEISTVTNSAASPLSLAVVSNPSSAEVTFCFKAAKASQVSITLYDLNGKTIKILRDGWVPAGTHTILWRADNNNGQRVGNGIYVCRLAARGSTGATDEVLVHLNQR